MEKPPERLDTFQSLVEIMNLLRSPNGCPWDREQNHESLTQYAVEETFEFVDAVEKSNLENMVEELGDMMLQIVFHAQIGKEEKTFTIEDVIRGICTKMVTRHPHVFGDVKVENADHVLKNWEKIKEAEKKNWDKLKSKEKGSKREKGFGIPIQLPSLQRAAKIGNKTRKQNFDWKKTSEVVKKLDEEVKELKAALKKKNKKYQEHEIGDILFTVSQIARHQDLDAESALRKTNTRFENRFFKMKELAKKKGLKFEDLKPNQLEKLWQDVKKQEK